MNAVCPSCGVAVVPGYVKCPKCHAKLPSYGTSRTRLVEGGTAVPQRGFPYVAVIVPVALVSAIAVYFGLVRATDKPKPAAAPSSSQDVATAPRPTVTTDPGVAPAAPPPTTTGPSLAAITSDLQRELQRQRLWSTIEIAGSRVDVRSGACGEPAMAPALDAARESLRSAGATQVRCLAQSGSVVFQRDL